MLIDLDTMGKMHDVQYEMMTELKTVLDRLNIKYYFVHGSLLGAVTVGGFIPEDDDIDIAIFRDDYNKLIKYGHKYLKKYYFLQASTTDDFPLAFAKMRDSRTTFRQPVLAGYGCNKGIYIDIFPIDYVTKSYTERLKEKILTLRLNSRLPINSSSFLRWSAKVVATLIYPSWQGAANKREMLYSKREPASFVNVTNGKASEQSIPVELFGEGVSFKFRDMSVTCPLMYAEYLEIIYGKNFEAYNPAEDRMFEGELVKISADHIDFECSNERL